MELFGQDTVAEPYAVVGALRDRDPVHWSNEVDVWVLTRFDDVRTALHGPCFSSRVLVASAPPTGRGTPGDRHTDRGR